MLGFATKRAPAIRKSTLFARVMKFKAAFSEVGAGWLEKRFLPAFEKLSPARGVELVLLLTPSSVHLIHDAKANGGPEIHADFVVRTQSSVAGHTALVLSVAAERHSSPSPVFANAKVSELFDEETYKTVSNHGNKARRVTCYAPGGKTLRVLFPLQAKDQQ